MILSPLLLAPQEPSVDYDPGRAIPAFSMNGFKEVTGANPNPTGPRIVWDFRRDNPRATIKLRLSKKDEGRPKLVDNAGKPVKQNRTFGVDNSSLGRVNVFLTKMANGPFFTNWIPVPKERGKGFLQISGTRLSATDIRKIVEAVHWAEPKPKAAPTPPPE